MEFHYTKATIYLNPQFNKLLDKIAIQFFTDLATPRKNPYFHQKNMKTYPLGIQTFEKIIEGDFLYIDKTDRIYHLANTSGYYFYARPRRFGKSLLLSTLKSLYQGKKDLFKGLWIADKWDWTVQRPVIHLGFSSMNYQGKPLDEAIGHELSLVASKYSIDLDDGSAKEKFKALITNLAERDGKIALLIDEYDKPIIDYLGREVEQAQLNRRTLKTFYSVIKDCDPYIEFMLITGVSKFSKVSIFSELNNLQDITFHKRYAGLTGISQQELEENFREPIQHLTNENGQSREELLDDIRRWYNGYSWEGKMYLYNPYSLMSYFDFEEFKNFWFETGTPTFLLELMNERKMVKLEKIEVGEASFSSYDIERLQLIPILFQTGYLTIKEKKTNGLYVLDYPNMEVRISMLQNIIGFLRHDEYAYSTPTVIYLREAFENRDLERIIKLIKSIFKNIPNQLFKSKREFYYHSLIYLVFYYLGEYIESEVNTNDGRLDAVVKTSKHIYILEFKLDKDAQIALDQIKDKKYAEKYYADEREKVLIGINFSSEQKTVDDWKYEVVE